MRRLTVLMPFHTPFYAPLAAGVALGHFRDEGLDVSSTSAAAFGKGTIPALLDGDIEISLGGLMRSFELADRSGPIVVHFAEVCSRNGFFLLSRDAPARVPRGRTWSARPCSRSRRPRRPGSAC